MRYGPILKNYIKLLRGEFFIASLLPVFIALAFSAGEGHPILPGILALTAAGALAVHGLTNVSNEYFDYINGVDTARSAGVEHLLLAGSVSVSGAKKMIVLFAVLCLAASLAIYLIRGPWLFALGMAGSAGGFFYTAPPLAYKYRGLGELAAFLLMGPMLVAGAYAALTGRFSLHALALSLPVGMLIAAVLNSNNIRDIDEDRDSGIRTSAVILGYRRSSFLYTALMAGPFLWALAAWLSGLFGPMVLIVLAAAPLAIGNIIVVRRRDREAIRDIDIRTVKLYVLFCALLAVSLFI